MEHGRVQGGFAAHVSRPSLLSPFVDRLARHSRLSPEAEHALLNLPANIRQVERGACLIADGQRASESRVVLSGFLYRQRLTGSGAREILSVHVPGEIVDLHNSFLNVADHNVEALTRATVAIVPRDALDRAATCYADVARSLLVETLVDGSILMEWLLNASRRSARQRLAHLLCELALRLEAAGLGERARYRIPMSQEELADCLGLTHVHINRLLRLFEGKGLIARDGRDLTIAAWEPLAEEGDFDPLYLHLGQAEAPGL